jgi:hypothetical protein
MKDANIFFKRATAALLAVFFVATCSERNTIYSKTFTHESFDQIAIGSSIEEVINKVGEPIFIQINLDRENNGGYNQMRVYKTDLPSLVNYTVMDKVELYLHFSHQRVAGRPHKRYEMTVNKGIVIEKIDNIMSD